MATYSVWKHWGRQFFRHGLETHASQVASVGNISVNSQMLMAGPGSYSATQAFAGIIASAAASLTGISATSLSTMRSAIVNQVASLAEISGSSLSTLRNLVVSQIASLTGIDATSLATIRSLVVNQVSSLSGVDAASLSNFRNLTVSQVGSFGGSHVGSLISAGVASLAVMIVGSTAGVVSVASNAVTATVSSPHVTAAGAVIATVQQSYGAGVIVASKVAGVSFAVQLTGSADANNAYSVAWAIMN